MRLDLTFLTSLLLTSVAANTVPPQQRRHVVRVEGQPQDAPPVEDSTFDLWKRRGGGGGGGRGGGGGGRGGGTRGGGSRGGGGNGGSPKSGSSGGGSRGGSGGGSSSGRGTNTKSDSTAGGYSRGGTGPQPSYAGGHYGGGSRVPFTSGSRSPSGIGARGPLAGSALAFWPGLWIGGAYMYGPYNYHHRYHNDTSDEDEEREIICACAEDSVCMCDEIDDDDDFWDDLIGDGDYDKLNKTLVDVSEVNGTTTILVNGTLPKGTTVHSDDEDDYAEYLTNAANKALQTLGLWPAVGAMMGMVMLV